MSKSLLFFILMTSFGTLIAITYLLIDQVSIVLGNLCLGVICVTAATGVVYSLIEKGL